MAKLSVEPVAERATVDDPALDFCLWSYTPPQPPGSADSLRSINLLLDSAECAGVGAEMRQLCQVLRAAIGDWQTVWGVKWADDQLSWELYFYDYARTQRRCAVADVVAALSEQFDCQLRVDERIHYFMFSVDIDVELLRRQRPLTSCNLYLGNVANHGAMISSGLSYHYQDGVAELRNLYYFFAAREGLDDVCEKLALSVHNPSDQLPLAQLLPSPLLGCRTLVVAHKSQSDALYFSGIAASALDYAVRRAALPAPLVAAFKSDMHRYQHLLFDIGVDYRTVDGKVEWSKFSYYGVM